MRRLPTNQYNSAIYRERDRHALSRLVMLLFCGMSLAGGFIYAAGQHFAAVRYGYKSEELRRARLQLLEEQGRLLLEREQAAAPARLESAAREIGLQPVRAPQISRKIVVATPTSNAAAIINPAAGLHH
jgi:cell division protein FtsL